MNEKTVSWKQIALVAIGVAALLVGTWEVMRWRQDQADRVLIQEMQENMRDQARINEKNLEALRIKQQQNEKAMATHPKVAHIAFTGGPETARHVVRGSAENLASTSLELGGKSPFIVFEDADLDSAVNAQISGIFAATGQSCVAGSRLIIQASVKDAFLAKLKAKAEAIKIAAPGVMRGRP